MREYTSYYDLGATLYTPCTHGKLSSLLEEGPSNVRSRVFCLEDAVREDELSIALNNLKQSLKTCADNPRQFSKVKKFIRPRNPLVLSEILCYENIEQVDGFVLPKFDLNTAHLYKKVIEERCGERFSYMPTLETAQAFDKNAMQKLSRILKSWGDSAICLRIGGNDLMSLLGIKRMRGMTIYETPLRTVIDQLIITFRPEGYELSSPVFDIIDDADTLKKEVEMDIAYGFYAKTAIHPRQIGIIENAFLEFTEQHCDQVEKVLDARSRAVFSTNGQMMETTCHKGWAKRASRLAKKYN
ncbi:HpcH/HpaI aldolase/citrate lyase family protein [Agarilytica rhodophyticola]|uniref:HpcH/HpaI aldolase/citrate lyase family protein n=1 Tax=Agarilytica rhodophyticola TaxID=1737490 RepID=UPI000B342B1B|nr:HpcH/HpaI aldolase/citrate lyase family protein [Agarilytica rhodophyticola]